MQIKLIHKNKTSNRLLLIFAGWAMDSRPFCSLTHDAYNIAVAYDYRSPDLPQNAVLDSHDEICLIAWSFGVPAANDFMRRHTSLPITARIAVNGTLQPVDDLCGIPKTIFEGTLNNLSGVTLAKFMRRLCGSSQTFSKFSASAPQRTDILELADELRAISRLTPATDPADILRWDAVFISDSDRIIPTENQQRAWLRHPNVAVVPGPHLPDFATILTRSLINKPLIAKRFNHSSLSYESAADAQRKIAARLASLTADAISDPAPSDILEIGCGTGLLTRFIVDRLRPANLTLWDISPISADLPGSHRQCDAETEIRNVNPQSLDIITSASTIQWFNSPAEFLRNCRLPLRSDGLLAISTFGPDNFIELRPFLPAALRYCNMSTWTDIVETAGFNVVTICEDNLKMHFADTLAMLRHIRKTGVNALPSGPAPAAATRNLLKSGPTDLTYHPIYIIAKKNRSKKCRHLEKN